MLDPNFVILYVDSPAKSAGFYADLLGLKPVESSPAFAMFALPSGIMLGLWARQDVAPAATVTGGGTEVCFKVAGDGAVDATYAEWRGRGLPIAQPPTAMDFGRTFVALDPDGHRLRVYAPAM